MTAPVVFVSYTHEGGRHTQRVQQFARRLRVEAGGDARLDVYSDSGVTNWPQWMRKQIHAADYVLMVFTATYRRRFNGEETGSRGRGVRWEGAIITNALYAATAASAPKFIPVAFSRTDLAQVPRDVFAGNVYLLPRDWDRLVRALWEKPSVEAPPIGTAPRIVAPAKGEGDARWPAHSRPHDRATRIAHGLSVLFVGAEKNTGLDLRDQLKQTKAAIRRAPLGQSLEVTGIFDVTLDELIMELHRRSPAVLHLSGKQEGGQVKLHDAKGRLTPVSADHLADLLAQFQHMLRMVILDTCHSLPQARKVVRTVDFAVGVSGDIAEPVAVDFFAMFYNALASGSSVKRAYDVAWALQLARIKGDRTYRREVEEIVEEDFDAVRHLPRLVSRRSVNAGRVVLLPS